MKKAIKRTLLIIGLCLMVMSSTAAAADSQASDGTIKPDYVAFSIFPKIDGFDVPEPHFYMFESDGIFGNVMGIIASVMLIMGTSLLRIGIMIMDFGMHPTFLNGIIEDITTRIQSNGWTLVQLLIPIVVIISFVLLGKDYLRGAASTTVRRGMVLVVSLCIVGLSFAMPVTTMVKALTFTTEFSNWFTGQMTKVFIADGESPSEDGQDANRVVYYQVWDMLAYKPFELGEIGKSDIRITKEEADKINKMIEPYKVKAGLRWGDVLLWFSPGSDDREDILDYYSDRYKENYDYAQNAGFRLLLGVVMVIVTLLATLFLIIMGAMLLALAAYFIGLLCAGAVILPFSLIPSEQVFILKYLTRLLSVFLAMFFINVYIALVFVVVRFLSFTDGGWSFLGGMMLVTVLFILATVMFFVLLSKMQSVPMFGEVNKVMSPVRKAGGRVRSNVSRRFRRSRAERRQDKRRKARNSDRMESYEERFDDEDEDDDDEFFEDPLDDDDWDEEEREYAARGGSSSRRRTRSDRLESSRHETVSSRNTIHTSRSVTRGGSEVQGERRQASDDRVSSSSRRDDSQNERPAPRYMTEVLDRFVQNDTPNRTETLDAVIDNERSGSQYHTGTDEGDRYSHSLNGSAAPSQVREEMTEETKTVTIIYDQDARVEVPSVASQGSSQQAVSDTVASAPVQPVQSSGRVARQASPKQAVSDTVMSAPVQPVQNAGRARESRSRPPAADGQSKTDRLSQSAPRAAREDEKRETSERSPKQARTGEIGNQSNKPTTEENKKTADAVIMASRTPESPPLASGATSSADRAAESPSPQNEKQTAVEQRGIDKQEPEQRKSAQGAANGEQNEEQASPRSEPARSAPSLREEKIEVQVDTREVARSDDRTESE
ncbi:hypothetical protein ACFSR7_06210 [Cohnella sp. GCM10020058]|uniref:hypothetical protein n=1 Tax=Cohnella sp. GCM10020058 TaxID=3317330 RepID=UPI00362B8D22